MSHEQQLPVMEELCDPEQLAAARTQDERFDRNWVWFRQHAAEIYAAHRGKCVCVAGRQAFAADTTEEALALAKAAHPDDDGRFTLYIPRESMERVYADRRRVAPMP